MLVPDKASANLSLDIGEKVQIDETQRVFWTMQFMTKVPVSVAKHIFLLQRYKDTFSRFSLSERIVRKAVTTSFATLLVFV